jgi:hypothetical protein
MAETAVRMGTTIGVMATLRTTLDPTIALLQQKANEAGRTITIAAAEQHARYGDAAKDLAEHVSEHLAETIPSLGLLERILLFACSDGYGCAPGPCLGSGGGLQGLLRSQGAFTVAATGPSAVYRIVDLPEDNAITAASHADCCAAATVCACNSIAGSSGRP